MSVESTIKSLLEESRKLKQTTDVTENVVTKGAVAADGMQKISSPDKVGGDNEDNKRNNVDDEPEAKGGTSKKPNPATQGAVPAETMAKVQAEAFDELTDDELDLIESLSEDDFNQLDELSNKTLTSYIDKVTSTTASERAKGKARGSVKRLTKNAKDGYARAANRRMVSGDKNHPMSYTRYQDNNKTPPKQYWNRSNESFDITEDVNALFNGEDGLTEEFRQKAETIFEAAVVSRVKEEVARIEEQYSELLESRVEEIKEGLVDHIDGYLNLMVEKWMEQNEVALESGMKNDILENFVSGLKNLFVESYIEVPEEKFDVVADLEAKLEEATQKIDEVYADNVALRKQVNEHARLDIIAQVSEGLSDLEVEKFSTLAEEIAFEDSESFAQKMQVIRENYFSKKPAKEVTNGTFLAEETIQEEKAVIPASMSQYVQAINMTVRK